MGEKNRKMTEEELAAKLKDLRERRGQASKDAVPYRRHLKRAENRVLKEMRDRKKGS